MRIPVVADRPSAAGEKFQEEHFVCAAPPARTELAWAVGLDLAAGLACALAVGRITALRAGAALAEALAAPPPVGARAAAGPPLARLTLTQCATCGAEAALRATPWAIAIAPLAW